MTDILSDLEDLVIQATTERSHYYVAKCAILAAKEIKALRYRLQAVSHLVTGGSFENHVE